MSNLATSLYSHKAENSLHSLIQRIEGKQSHFVTNFMGSIHDVNSPMATRLEAWQNPQTRMWQVDRITYVSMGQDVDAIIKKETLIRPGICFFDALHYLSAFEHAENVMGKHIIPVELEATPNNVIDIIHWRQAAKESGQAVDADGLVQPCAYGRILVDGNFHAKEMDIATKSTGPTSAGSSWVGVRIADQMLTDVLSKGAPQVAQSDLLTTVKNRMAEVAKYEDLIKIGKELTNGAGNLEKEDFRSAYATKTFFTKQGERYVNIAHFGAVLTLGLSPLIKYASGDIQGFPERGRQVLCDKFNNAASKLANEDDKKLCFEFTKNLMFAFYMSRAQALYKEDGKKRVDAGIKDVERAGKIMGLSDIDLERLKAEYIDGGLQYKDFKRIPHLVWEGYNNNERSYRYDIPKDQVIPLVRHLRQRKDAMESSRTLG